MPEDPELSLDNLAKLKEILIALEQVGGGAGTASPLASLCPLQQQCAVRVRPVGWSLGLCTSALSAAQEIAGVQLEGSQGCDGFTQRGEFIFKFLERVRALPAAARAAELFWRWLAPHEQVRITHETFEPLTAMLNLTADMYLTGSVQISTACARRLTRR